MTTQNTQNTQKTTNQNVLEEIPFVIELWNYLMNLETIPYNCFIGFCSVMLFFVIPYGLLRIYTEKETNPNSFKQILESLNAYKKKSKEIKKQEQNKAPENNPHNVIITIDDYDRNESKLPDLEEEVYEEDNENDNGSGVYNKKLMLEEYLQGKFASSVSIPVKDIEEVQNRNKANNTLSSPSKKITMGKIISNALFKFHNKTKKVLGPIYILVMINSIPFLTYALSFVFQQYAVNHDLFVQQIRPIFKK